MLPTVDPSQYPWLTSEMAEFFQNFPKETQTYIENLRTYSKQYFQDLTADPNPIEPRENQRNGDR